MADGRYAPSPTGPLHLGNLRTALLAWLFARSAGSRFRLRIEDVDTGRSRREHEAGQLADLTALGIDWDGPVPRQSERGAAYAAAVERLRADGLVYECFCTRAEIREAASAPHGDAPEGAYPGTCRELPDARRAQLTAEGRRTALRVRAAGAAITWTDRLLGVQTGVVDDFVLRRTDGDWAYNLAVVVDDDAQGIGEVVRGADLAPTTARQLWLHRALGHASVPAHAHVPLLLGPDGGRLAKRHGAVTLADRAALGQDAVAVRSELAASVGLCAPDDRPGLDELVAWFDPTRLGSSSETLH